MKTRTVAELSAFIRSDLAWRRKENHVLFSLLQSATESRRQALLRGAIAALYAHWEGFVRSAAAAYLDYVRRRSLTMAQLSPAFAALCVRSRLKSADQSLQLDSHADFMTDLLADWDRRANLPKGETISTGSNLSSTVFRGIVNGLGLPYRNEYQVAQTAVIDSLLGVRNKLAHGDWQVLDVDTYEHYKANIESLMTMFCESIEDAAASVAFIRRLVQLV